MAIIIIVTIIYSVVAIGPSRYAVAAWASHAESDRNHMASIGPSRYAVAAWPSHAESDRWGVITWLDINHRRSRHQHHHTFNMIVFVYF